MVDNTPDFDNMSEEEIMNWMESLAKRAGATEGFITSADMDIAEIDPDSVVIDEPGYVPYSERSGNSPPAAAKPEAPPPPPEPIIEDYEIEDDIATHAQAAIEGGSLDWLESLAADQSGSLFNLDLSAIEVAGAPAETPPPRVNPEAWLQNLAVSQGEGGSLEIDDSGDESDSDTLEWLETLAVRQGADRDELLTDASSDIPEPVSEVEPSAYTPFSFESPANFRSSTIAESAAANPEDFLRSLSQDSGYSEDGVLATQKPWVSSSDDANVTDAIAQGTVTPEQMQDFLERQMDRAMDIPEPELDDDSDEAEAAELERAELPEWLLQGIGSPPAPETPRDLPPLESFLPELDESAGDDLQIPAWLANVEEESEEFDLESFLNADEEPVSDGLEAASSRSVDTWAEAFDVEHDEGPADLTNPPEWYLQNLSDSQRIERATHLQEGEETAHVTELIDEPLPEESLLPEGEPQPLPEWMAFETVEPEIAAPEAEIVEVVAEAVAEDDGMPDWLQVQVESEDETGTAPWWDKSPEDADAAETIAPLRAEPVFVPPPAPAYSTQRPLDAAATLENARTLQRTGDLEGSLYQYESLIMSSADLDSVVDDLADLVRIHRENPVLHRLLGDGYVRQGHLQQALDIYREALNYL
ncbi:MAG: hypothetical protein IAE89_16420 [Anaerolineae bacterium]|nr:hypothetical protein [Anaerolineae bacterium]